MSNTVDFTELDNYIALAVERLSHAEYQNLQRKIGDYLGTANRRNIIDQVDPDGNKFEARKKSGTSSGKMFKKLRQRKHLTTIRSSAGLKVGWFGSTGRIARIHHYGLKQQLNHAQVQFAERQLIGINDDNANAIRDMIINHLDI